jgi:hypothetical protein
MPIQDETRDPIFVNMTTSPGAVEGFSSPQFIVKLGNVFYLTLAVWEFDKNHAGTPAEEAACDAIRALFEAKPLTDALIAMQVPTGPGGGGANQTHP